MLKNLQDTYFKDGICFGCGPANSDGLQIKSVVHDDEIICDWQAKPQHQAFPGIINGGILGALIDCHANWSAAYYLMREKNLDHPPCTVTAEYQVKLLQPTPLAGTIHLSATLGELKSSSAFIQVKLYANEELTATGQGVFVSVKPGHPAYHRW